MAVLRQPRSSALSPCRSAAQRPADRHVKRTAMRALPAQLNLNIFWLCNTHLAHGGLVLGALSEQQAARGLVRSLNHLNQHAVLGTGARGEWEEKG